MTPLEIPVKFCKSLLASGSNFTPIEAEWNAPLLLDMSASVISANYVSSSYENQQGLGQPDAFLIGSDPFVPIPPAIVNIIDDTRMHRTYSMYRQVPVWANVIPPTPIYAQRDITRYRKSYSSQRQQVRRIRLVRP